ncbi:hypothetical protein ACFLQ0_06925 [Nitrospinota bacterium]
MGNVGPKEFGMLRNQFVEQAIIAIIGGYYASPGEQTLNGTRAYREANKWADEMETAGHQWKPDQPTAAVNAARTVD